MSVEPLRTMLIMLVLPVAERSLLLHSRNCPSPVVPQRSIRQVWLAGVTVTFEEHLMTVDSDTGELVGALEAQVATGQFIK